MTSTRQRHVAHVNLIVILLLIFISFLGLLIIFVKVASLVCLIRSLWRRSLSWSLLDIDRFWT